MLFSFIRPDKKCKRFRALRIHPCKCIMILSRFCAVRIVGIANAHFLENFLPYPSKLPHFLTAQFIASVCIVIYTIRSISVSFQAFLYIFILQAAAFYRFLLKKIFMNPMLYHLLDVINFFHFNAPSFNMNFIRHTRVCTSA